MSPPWHGLIFLMCLTLGGLTVVSTEQPFETVSDTLSCTCIMNFITNMTEAVCTGKELTSVPPLSEVKCTFQKIDLTNNIISEVATSSFRSIPKLKILTLSYNKLSSVDEGPYDILVDLEEVYFSNNVINRINPDTFKSNLNLKAVSLSGNLLTHVDKDSPLLISSSISDLDVSYSGMTHVTHAMLSQLPNLRSIKLSGNPLMEIPADTFHCKLNLRKIEFRNLRWPCDCQLNSFLDFALGLTSHADEALRTELRNTKCFRDGRRERWSKHKNENHCTKGIVYSSRCEATTSLKIDLSDPGYSSLRPTETSEDLQEVMRQGKNTESPTITNGITPELESKDKHTPPDEETHYVVPILLVLFGVVLTSVIVVFIAYKTRCFLSWKRSNRGQYVVPEADVEEGIANPILNQPILNSN